VKESHVAGLALIKDRTVARNRGQNLINPLLRKQNPNRLRQIECQMKAWTEPSWS
jgi:transposase